MGTYICIRCGKHYKYLNPAEKDKALNDAKKCCIKDNPCYNCIAKNLCLSKDKKNPIQDADKFKSKSAGQIWEARMCRSG